MKNLGLIFLADLLFAACNSIDTVTFSGDLAMGEVVKGTLAEEAPKDPVNAFRNGSKLQSDVSFCLVKQSPEEADFNA